MEVRTSSQSSPRGGQCVAALAAWIALVTSIGGVTGCANLVGGSRLVDVHNEDLTVAPQSSLSEFFFEFENGEHHINRVTLLRDEDGSNLTAAFLDDSPEGDSWRFRARYVPVPGIEVRTMSGTCQNGECHIIEVEDPEFNEDHRMAISGFSFQLSQNSVPIGDFDQRVSRISFWPVEQFGYLQIVAFTGIPEQEFVWQVQYQMVPVADAALHRAYVTPITEPIIRNGSRRFPVEGESGRRVLSGFHFLLVPEGQGSVVDFDRAFHGETMPLRSLGVDLERGEFHFQDNDRNELVWASFRYLVLN